MTFAKTFRYQGSIALISNSSGARPHNPGSWPLSRGATYFPPWANAVRKSCELVAPVPRQNRRVAALTKFNSDFFSGNYRFRRTVFARGGSSAVRSNRTDLFATGSFTSTGTHGQKAMMERSR